MGAAMTQRKPMGMQWQSWIDKQINDAQARGDFDNLSGQGKPIEGLDGRCDEMWWLKQKLGDEGLSAAPPTVQARREVEAWLKQFMALPTETRVRLEAAKLNEEIRIGNRNLGPMLPQPLLDAEDLCRRWRQGRR